MDLGQFSLSLAVKDLGAAREFYEHLGFTAVDGAQEQNWLMMRNGDTHIGLFGGMFDHNTITFHPTDVRAIQRGLKALGVPMVLEADEDGTGPAHAMVVDPDGNPVLIDQLS